MNTLAFEEPYRSDPTIGCSVNMINKPFLERFKCFVHPMIKFIWLTRSKMTHLNEVRAKVGIAPTSNLFERAMNSLFLSDSFFGFDIPFPIQSIQQVKKKFFFRILGKIK